MSPWFLISRFGETTLLLPCALLLYLWLRQVGEARAARTWLIHFSAAALVTLASKLAFMGWGLGSPALDFTGLSGHSMMAAAVFPVLAHRFLPAARGAGAVVALGTGIAMALLVGYSRLAVDAHSVSEVFGGLAAGMAASLGFLARTAHWPRQPAPPAVAMAIVVLMLALPATGAHAPTTEWLENMAISLSGRERPFRRVDWPMGRVWHGALSRIQGGSFL